MNLSLIGATAAGNAAGEPELRTFHAQPCFVLATKEVELAITRTGGHMAPVTFFRDSEKPVKPYYVSPWQDEPPSAMPAPVLISLRGDFFCVPFGGNNEAVAGEKHPPHGEIVGDAWHHVGTKKTGDVTTLTLGIDTKVRKGHLTKELSLVDGQNTIYSRNLIEGFAGQAPLGHHATLAMPEKEGAVRIATSAFRFGMTNNVKCFHYTLYSPPFTLRILVYFFRLRRTMKMMKPMNRAVCQNGVSISFQPKYPKCT
jgi:hypothetical protein